MDPAAQGKYEGAVNGQEAKKANGRTLGAPVERFAKPLIHFDTPSTAAFVTPASISLFSGQDTSLTMQGDAHLTSAHTLSSVSGQTTSLYTHAGGIKAITANGPLSLRAHTDAQQIWSDKDLTIQSTTDEVRIQASQSITLTAGQSQIVIKGGDITLTCPGTWTVKAAAHDWAGGGSQPAELLSMPSQRVNIDPTQTPHDQFFVLRWANSGKPMKHQAFRIRRANGAIQTGTTDANGRSPLLDTANAAETLTIEVLRSSIKT